jgi:senataxin
LQDWDIERVKPVVSEVAKNLEQSNSPNEWLAKFWQNKLQSNAIHECFSNPTMLIRDAELNTRIKRLCSVPGFEIRGPAIALVSFLFSEDEELRDLAERSWKVQGPGITVAIFENNLLESLESATRRAQEQVNPEKLNQFFRGLSVIVHNVDKNVIMKCISGAERDPIKVAVHKLQPNPPFWHSVLRLFQALMLKLGQDVWEVISPLTPSGFGDVIFNDRLFSSLLRSTEQGVGGESQLLDLTEWMSEYIDSIEPLLRPTTAPVLIRQIFRNDLPALSRGLCFKEGMKILNSTLKAVESGTRTGNVLVRQAYDLFLEHEQIVLDVAFSTQTFEDELMEKHMLVAQRAALETVAAALKLNLLFFAADFEYLHRKNPEKPPYQMDLRINLWRIVAERLPLNDSQFYIQVLQAIRPITELDTVYVSIKEETLREEMQQFNARLADIDKPLANVMKSISRCSLSALDDLIRDKPSSKVIISLMIARSEDVAMSAEEITLAAQGADDRVDALRLMLVKDFSIPIPALTSIARQMCRLGLFAMMPRWVNISASVLDLLCDRTEGMIRKSDMESWAQAALRVYWETQWRCLGIIFRKSRRWALSEDKSAMIEFLRDSMDYAEGLFDNFWTFEQALRANIEEIKEHSREESWSDRLLQDASRALNPFTTILGIQDPHLLRTCQQLMCKILGLLAEKHVALEDRVFFLNLKKYLYPESFEDYDSSKANLTNLTETQKTELAFAAERLSPGFVPTGKNHCLTYMFGFVVDVLHLQKNPGRSSSFPMTSTAHSRSLTRKCLKRPTLPLLLKRPRQSSSLGRYLGRTHPVPLLLN